MKNEIPNHVAIVMDGNGRWAKKKGLPRTAGHKAGFDTLKKTSTYILNKGVKYLSVFAFSTENFKRSKEEVDYLMNLFTSKFKSEIDYFNKHNVKVVFSGKNDPLSNEVLNAMEELKEATKNNTGGVFNICINYGGQSEIVDATKRIVNLVKEGKLNIEELNVDNYYDYLYSKLPPIDFMIRTSGELRLSNFMLYSLSYSELYFTNTCFPDFNKKEFDRALEEYQNRNITKGSIK